MSVVKNFLQNSQENTCGGVSFLIKLYFLLKKTPVFSCKICDTPFLAEHLRTTASAEAIETV